MRSAVVWSDIRRYAFLDLFKYSDYRGFTLPADEPVRVQGNRYLLLV
jgi:hypothetical protein